jgi:hypothetical protein
LVTHRRHEARVTTQRFHFSVVTNFLLDLISNQIILAFMLAACCIINLARPGATPNDYLVFVAFLAIALVLDAALSFLVFADSQARYGQFSTTQSGMPRFAAYLTACASPSVSRASVAARRPRARTPAPSSVRRRIRSRKCRCRWPRRPGICLADGRAVAYNNR